MDNTTPPIANSRDNTALTTTVKLTDERVPSPPSEERAAPPLPGGNHEYRKALFELQRDASWYGASARQTLEKRALALGFAEARADGGAAVEHALRQGDQTREELRQLNDLAYRYGANAPELLAALEEAVRRVTWWSGFRAKAVQTVANASAARSRWLASHERPSSIVRPTAVEHRIQLLPPGSRWTLLIDEGGAMPDGRVAPVTLPRGRFVGLLVPEPSPLPLLTPGWHAVEQHDPQAIDEVVQAVLEAPVGVLGLELAALPRSLGDPWVTGVLELIHWVCRLLPMSGATQLTVLIEQRGEQVAGTSWKAAATEVLRHLVEQDPERYRQLGLELRLITKSTSGLNGYVDALAFTWSSTALSSMARLKQSGLHGGCLHPGDARVLRESWEASQAGRRLSGEQWRSLMRHAGTEVPGSLPHFLLSRVRERCLQEPDFWQELLGAVRAHLEAKAVRLRELGREVEFLASCMPQGRNLKPLLRLAWLTARLERANHSGAVDDALARELDALGARLFDEAPTLVCQADLDRAVLATNRFDFEGATRALARWKEVVPAIPGLQHWGRIQSSFGQHAAFCGFHAEAEPLFLSALEAFSLLSDEDLGHAEKLQTATYLALSTMDTPGAPLERIRERVSAIVSLTPDSIRHLSRSSAAHEKYTHHLLIRFLVLHGSQSERRAYLAERAGWQVAEGHPWPLIELYRALLLHPEGELIEAGLRLRSGVERALAVDQGPVMNFIGLVIGLAGSLLGLPLPSPMPDVAALRTALPRAPWHTVEAAREGRWTQGPVALLERCLPFNFH